MLLLALRPYKQLFMKSNKSASFSNKVGHLSSLSTTLRFITFEAKAACVHKFAKEYRMYWFNFALKFSSSNLPKN